MSDTYMGASAPSGYGGASQPGSRDAITQALMAIRQPPPQSPVPQPAAGITGGGGMPAPASQPLGPLPQSQPAAQGLTPPPTGAMGPIGGVASPGLTLPGLAPPGQALPVRV